MKTVIFILGMLMCVFSVSALEGVDIGTTAGDYKALKEACQERIYTSGNTKECDAELKEIRDEYLKRLKKSRSVYFEKKKKTLANKLKKTVQLIHNLPQEQRDDIKDRLNNRLDELEVSAIEMENDNLLLMVEALREVLTSDSNEKEESESDISGYYFVLPARSEVYTTAKDTVRLEGVVPAGEVDHIIVNGTYLTRFTPGSEAWYYFATTAFGNLQPGKNEYLVTHYDSNHEVIHTQTYVIYKEGVGE